MAVQSAAVQAVSRSKPRSGKGSQGIFMKNTAASIAVKIGNGATLSCVVVGNDVLLRCTPRNSVTGKRAPLRLWDVCEAVTDALRCNRPAATALPAQ